MVDLRSGEQVLPVHGVAFNLGINLVQPLYTFGKIEAARKAAAAGIDVARAQVDKDRADVTFNVTRAYWLLKWARAAEATLDDGMARLKEWVTKINDDIDKGKTTYTENDLVRLKLALDTAELTALDVEKAQASSGCRGCACSPTTQSADIDDSELDIIESGRAAAHLLRGRGAHAPSRGAHDRRRPARVARRPGAAVRQPHARPRAGACRSPTLMRSRWTIRRTPS